MTNKCTADAYRDFTQFMISFCLEFGKNWTAASQGKASPAALTSKIIHYSLSFAFLFACSHPHLRCSLCLFQLCLALLLSPFLWQEILTIADQSSPSIAGGSGVWLGRVWMHSSSGSLSAASKQRMLLPTSKALLHTWQTGGQESECRFFFFLYRGYVFEVGR